MNHLGCLIGTICFSIFALRLCAANKSPNFIKAMRNGADASIVLKISGDDGSPVVNAKVNVLMGMNFEGSYVINGKTDTNGVFVVEGKTTGNEIEITVNKDGYYQTFKKLCFINMGEEAEVKDGKWQPWGKEVNLKLRKITNPISLVCMRKGFVVPVTNKWVSFDMECKDWVYPPTHKGKTSDFEVFVVWDGKVTAWSKLLKLDVRFPEKDAGFYLADVAKESVFSGVYAAQTNKVFCKEFSCEVLNGSKRVYSGVEPNKQIVIRSRCKHDQYGNLIKANYSSLNWFNIHGGFKGYVELAMTYMFNPVSNDTNLEPKQ